MNDTKYAWRTMRQNPGFTAIVILTLGLGIGVNTAVFSLFNDLVLRPLPFPEPQQLVRAGENYGRPDTFPGESSYPDFRDWRNWNRTFSALAAYSGYNAVLKADDPEPLSGVMGSANLLELLGAEPILGRRFLPEEDDPSASAGADAIIISYRLWQKRFGGNRDVLGKTLILDGVQYSIVGVMAAGFDSRTDVSHPDFWMTAAAWKRPGLWGKTPVSEERDIYFLRALGRLKPGVSLDQAKADMNRVGALVTEAHNDTTKHGVALRDLQTALVGDGRGTLLMLLGVTALVFLIACADVGGLVLARATRRQKEMTIRAAIGASRGRIARQLLVESMLLALAGCATGIWFAATTSGLLRTLLGLADAGAVAFDWRVLGFALLAAVISAIVFGLVPLFDSSRLDLAKGLREATLATTESTRQRRLHNVMVTAQLALAMVLLSGTSLMPLSLWRLQHVDAGFEPRNVLTFPVKFPQERFTTPAPRAPYIADLVRQLQAIPGVEIASAVGSLPLEGDLSRTALENVDGQPIEVKRRTGIVFSAVTPDYFRALHIALRRGREFTDQDRVGAQPVVIINETAARRHFAGKDPIGRMVTPSLWGGAGSPTMPRMVVGVVSDVKYTNLAERTAPAIYWPMAQVPSHAKMWACVRTAGDPLAIASAVRAKLREFDKEMPLYNVQPLSYYYDETLSRPRSTAGLVASFSMLALLLTSIGLYGVISYSVARRTREIGIRMALGARSGDVLGRFLRHGLAMGIAGALIGIPVAIGTERLLRAQLYGITKLEIAPIAAGAGLLILVAIIASYLPARRATKVDPLTALRAD